MGFLHTRTLRYPETDAYSWKAIFQMTSIAFLGIAFVRVWVTNTAYQSYTQSDDGAFSGISNLFRIATLLLLVLYVWKRGDPSPRAKNVLSAVSCALMVIGALCCLVQECFDVSPLGTLALVGACLGSIGNTCLGLQFAEFFARIDIKKAVVYAALALILGVLFLIVLALFPRPIVLMVCAIVPVLALWSYRTSLAETPPADDALDPTKPGRAAFTPYDDEPTSSFVRLGIGLAVFAFALGVARGFPLGEPSPISTPYQIGNHTLVVVLSFVFIWWVAIKDKSLSFKTLWRGIVVVALTGILVLSLLDRPFSDLGSALSVAANSIMLGVLTLVCSDIAHHSSKPTYFYFGWAFLIYYAARHAGREFVGIIGAYSPSGAVAVAVMVYLLVMSIFLLFNDDVFKQRRLFEGMRRETRTPGLEAGVAGMVDSVFAEEGVAQFSKGGFKRKCETLQRNFKLTPREMEIVMLYAQGRSRKRIAEELFLSEHTVHGHTKNIYATLDVHSRQELLDLLDAQEE